MTLRRVESRRAEEQRARNKRHEVREQEDRDQRAESKKAGARRTSDFCGAAPQLTPRLYLSGLLVPLTSTLKRRKALQTCRGRAETKQRQLQRQDKQ
jgi:hypothetical protein